MWALHLQLNSAAFVAFARQAGVSWSELRLLAALGGSAWTPITDGQRNDVESESIVDQVTQSERRRWRSQEIGSPKAGGKSVKLHSFCKPTSGQ